MLDFRGLPAGDDGVGPSLVSPDDGLLVGGHERIVRMRIEAGIGHALERLDSFAGRTHGEAVSIGMGFAARLANYAKIAVTFPTRSRWSRTFMPIR